MSHSINNFSELNTDSHPVNTKPSVMTDAINASLTTKGENQLILQNLQGTDHVATLTPGFRPLGVKVFNDIAYIISGKFDANGVFLEGEIGTYPSPDWGTLLAPSTPDPNNYLPLVYAYQPLRNFCTSTVESVLNTDTSYHEPFRTNLFNFLSDRLIEIELQPSYDDSVNIIFTDDYNSIRLVNSRFRVHDDGKRASVAQRRQTKDTNTYSNARFGAIRLIRQANKIPKLEFLGVHSGGVWKGGHYRFYFQYTDSDGARTDIIEESRLVSINFDDHGTKVGETTDKLIRFRLSNLDKAFSGVKVLYSFAEGKTGSVTTVQEIQNIYDFESDDDIIITLYGSELTTTINKSLLNLDYSSIGSVKSITQYNDQLILGNITTRNNDFQTLKNLSQRLKITEASMDMEIKTLGSGYADPNNIYNFVGVWAGETYEVGIVYILKNGQGLTPVFPIRGGDNYDNDFMYTSSSPIITDDGFATGSQPSQNRHGSYRTNKSRRKLYGPSANLTEVRYFQVDMAPIRTHSYIQQNTDGFFFVRKKRKKDALVQGYTCNAMFEPVQKGFPASGNFFVGDPFYTGSDRASWVAGNGVLTNIYAGLGIPSTGDYNEVYYHTKAKYDYPIDKVKVLPCPGRALDIVRVKAGQKPYTQTYQGGIAGNELGAELNKYWSFYSSDQLVDPQLFAAIFNNESKGMMIDPSPVIMKANIDGTSIANQVWSVFSLQWWMTGFNSLGANLEAVINPNGYKFIIQLLDPSGTPFSGGGPLWDTFTPDPIDPNILVGDILIQIQGRDVAILNKTAQIVCPMTVNITNPTAVTVTFTIPIINYVGAGLTTTAPIIFTGTSGWSATAPSSTNWVEGDNSMIFGWPNAPIFRDFTFAPVSMTVVDPATLTPYTEAALNVKWEASSWDYQASVNVISDPSSVNCVKLCHPTSHNFSPEVLTAPNLVDPSVNTYRRNFMQYVMAEQDVFTNYQFASRSDRNLYYAERGVTNGYLGNVYSMFMPDDLDAGLTTPSGQTITTPNFDPAHPAQARYTRLWQHMVDFEDYVGIRMSVGEPKLFWALHNDWDGIAFNTYGIDASSLVKRWTIDGVRWGVQTNIYQNPHGAISKPEWKNKYGSASADESYFAVTQRFRWSDFTPANTVVDIFGGDCFLTYTYKRVQKPLGIPGLPTADSWKTYDTANRAAGLTDAGIIFPMVLECNYNAALRANEKYSETESLLYGKDRSFYPFDQINMIRQSKQSEAKNYNHGYTWMESDKQIPKLNDRAPSLNINYGNRIMVSKPSVAGNFYNGYTDFSGLNFRDYNKQLGQITKVVSHGDYCYCIFESGIGVVPINQRTMVTPETGGVFLDDAQVLAQKMVIISTEYGSDQQFGIIKTDSHVYGVDLGKTTIWRISGDGGHRLDLISDFAIQKVLNEYKARITSNYLPVCVKANYDREKNDVIFSFFNENNGIYTTDIYETISVPNGNGGVGVGTGLDTTEIIPNTTTPVPSTAAPAKQAYIAQRSAFTPPAPIRGQQVFKSTTNDGQEVTLISKEDGTVAQASTKDSLNRLVPQFSKKNKLGSIYWNETLGKWISRLSWNPLWVFNLSSNMYSFNSAVDQGRIWRHFSTEVPYCHIYGQQEKFIFEFMIVDNASAQKILDNLQFICNRAFPGRITYGLIENDVDYETFASINNGYVELMKQRHEPTQHTLLGNGNYDNWAVSSTTTFTLGGPVYFTMQSAAGDPISQEESERIVGGFVVFGGNIYIIGASFQNNGIFYNEILDQNGINILGAAPAGWTFTTVDFGIIRQNMEYIEDHLYVEVGRDDSKSLIRDKAIRVRVMYEGYDYVTVQSVISSFVYSFG